MARSLIHPVLDIRVTEIVEKQPTQPPRLKLMHVTREIGHRLRSCNACCSSMPYAWSRRWFVPWTINSRGARNASASARLSSSRPARRWLSQRLKRSVTALAPCRGTSHPDASCSRAKWMLRLGMGVAFDHVSARVIVPDNMVALPCKRAMCWISFGPTLISDDSVQIALITRR